MTKKDYILIADAFRQAHGQFSEPATATLNRFAEVLADRLATTNPLFNRAKFLDACDPITAGFYYGKR